MSFFENFIDEGTNHLIVHHPLPNDGLKYGTVAKKIKTDVRENLYFFKANRQIRRFRGETNYVNPPENHLFEMKDCDVLHNHPNGSSFSIADVEAIVRYNALSLTVVSPENSYSVERPETGWNIDFSEPLIGAYMEEAVSTTETFLRKLEAQGEIFSSEKGQLENHYIRSIFFQLLNIGYEKKVEI